MSIDKNALSKFFKNFRYDYSTLAETMKVVLVSDGKYVRTNEVRRFTVNGAPLGPNGEFFTGMVIGGLGNDSDELQTINLFQDGVHHSFNKLPAFACSFKGDKEYYRWTVNGTETNHYGPTYLSVVKNEPSFVKFAFFAKDVSDTVLPWFKENGIDPCNMSDEDGFLFYMRFNNVK